MAPLSCTTPDAISMESKALWVCREMPVKEMDIFISKMLVDICLILPMNLIAMILLSVSFNLELIEVIALFLLILFAGLTMTQFGLLLNLKYPKLKFQSETEVIKDSMSASLAVYIPLVISFFLGVLYAVLPINFLTYVWILDVSFAIFAVIVNLYLRTKGVEAFKKLYC